MRIQKSLGTVSADLKLVGLRYPMISSIVEQLTVDNPQYLSAVKYSPWGAPAGIPKKLEFAYSEGRTVNIMRGAYSMLNRLTRSKLKQLIKWKDARVRVKMEFPRPRLELNEEQAHAMNVLRNSLSCGKRPFGNLLLLASTAVGKTILQASVAAELGQNTLIICPTEQILHAWYADLKKLFGLSGKQLGLIKSSSFRIGEPFTLASTATLGRREARWPELNKAFGTIVVDEVQGVTAPRLYEFLKQSPAAYLVGATATQETRSGERNLHLVSLFGEPLVEMNTYDRETQSSMQISHVNVINTEFIYEGQHDNIDWVDLGLALTTDDSRNELIVSNVHREWLEGRSVLVVTKLREHTTLLKELLQERGVTNVNEINGDTNANRAYTKRLIAAINKREVTCVVATIQAIKVGANIPALDSLHIAIPPANKRDFEQLIGRIRRKAEGKDSALVTYYSDLRVGYMMHLYRKVVVPTFRKLKLPGFQNMYVA